MIIQISGDCFCTSRVESDSRSGVWSNQLFQESFIISKGFLLPASSDLMWKVERSRLSFFLTFFSPFHHFELGQEHLTFTLLSSLSETFRAFCIFDFQSLLNFWLPEPFAFLTFRDFQSLLHFHATLGRLSLLCI